MPLAVLVLRPDFVKASFVGTSVEIEALIEAKQQAAAGATVVVGPGGRDVRLAGELTEGVAMRLARLLDAHPDIVRIHLTSEGGLADEGRAVGDVIAARKLTTFVPDYCVSACTLAFVRGKDRLVLPDARLGFHSPYENGLLGAVYKSDASDEQAAYLAAGVSASFIKIALNVDPTSIWYPSIDQLEAAGVVTASVERYQLPDSILDDAPTIDGARVAILQNFPILEGFLARAPDRVGAIAAWYLAAYRQARSEGEDVDALQTIIADTVTVSLTNANDATLLDLVRYLDRALAVTEDPATCAAIGGDWDLLVAQRQLGGDERATTLLTQALVGPSTSSAGIVSTTSIQAGTAGVAQTCAEWRRIYAGLIHKKRHDALDAARARLTTVSLRDRATLQALSRCERGGDDPLAEGPRANGQGGPANGLSAREPRILRCPSDERAAQAVALKTVPF